MIDGQTNFDYQGSISKNLLGKLDHFITQNNICLSFMKRCSLQ